MLHVSISTVTVSSDQVIPLPPGGNLVVVGPNGGGKSRLLRDIAALCKNPGATTAAATAVGVVKEGSFDEAKTWVDANLPSHPHDDGRIYYSGPGSSGFMEGLLAQWEDTTRFWNLADAFVTLIDAETRVGLGNAVGSINFSVDPATHPLHRIYLNGGAEDTLSAHAHRAFGVPVFLDRFSGNILRLRVGPRPPLPADGVPSAAYIEATNAMAPLEEQGDGVRSFVGLLLHVMVASRFVTLIDEPEAFLHPPQAYQLGRVLAGSPGQSIVATHSSDIVRGMLSVEVPTTVVRIVRRDAINEVSVLHAEDVTALWGDPLLRYSLALDGLFHQVVVVCESDSDCRFYQSVHDVLMAEGGDGMESDVLFTHCGGKQRSGKLADALRQLDVPVRIVVDFDVFREETDIRRVVESVGQEWSEFKPQWAVLSAHINASGFRPLIGQVREGITAVLDAAPGPRITADESQTLRNVVRVESGWDQLKLAGIGGVPGGDAMKAAEHLLSALSGIGVHVVPVGELERFVPEIPGHGPAWVTAVHEAGRHKEAGLTEAREFVARVTALP